MPTTITEKQELHDVVFWEVNQEYTRVSGTITNNSGGTVSLVPGTALKDVSGDFEAAGAADVVVGILATHVTDLADSATKVLPDGVINLGPCNVNMERVLQADQATTITATQKTALKALGMKEVSEPATSQLGP